MPRIHAITVLHSLDEEIFQLLHLVGIIRFALRLNFLHAVGILFSYIMFLTKPYRDLNDSCVRRGCKIKLNYKEVQINH